MLTRSRYYRIRTLACIRLQHPLSIFHAKERKRSFKAVFQHAVFNVERDVTCKVMEDVNASQVGGPQLCIHKQLFVRWHVKTELE